MRTATACVREEEGGGKAVGRNAPRQTTVLGGEGLEGIEGRWPKRTTPAFATGPWAASAIRSRADGAAMTTKETQQHHSKK